MLHTKSQGHRPSGSGEEDFLRVFTIYGRGGHLGHVTKTIWTNFPSPILRSLHMKYEFNWPSSFRGEDVWKCWQTTDDRRRTDDGRRSHWYTISSPMSLRLRWANNSWFSRGGGSGPPVPPLWIRTWTYNQLTQDKKVVLLISAYPWIKSSLSSSIPALQN